MIAAKQNQKFPFHFLSAPPPPPPEEKKKGKENFWVFVHRPKGADEARIIGHQDSIQNTFELCPVDTATNRNPNSRQKCGRAEGATLGLNFRQTQSPPRFSTLRVAPRLPIQII